MGHLSLTQVRSTLQGPSPGNGTTLIERQDLPRGSEGRALSIPCSYRGDLLRSVPCVTVWHWKIKSKILWTREKMIKVHLVYVPRMMKNIMGHLPDLWYNYKTLLKYFGCHTVTFDRSDITKSSLKPIQTGSLHWKILSCHLKSLPFTKPTSSAFMKHYILFQKVTLLRS